MICKQYLIFHLLIFKEGFRGWFSLFEGVYTQRMKKILIYSNPQDSIQPLQGCLVLIFTQGFALC